MSSEDKGFSAVANEVLRSVEVYPISREERRRWDLVMRQHHYLGLKSLVGESLRYVAIFQGQWLALLGWTAAAFKCKVRDEWIGWSPTLCRQRLPLIANNARFLILPGIHLPNLASRVLTLNLKRLSQDWQNVYGHPLLLVETFVDHRYFLGTCYKAAGWLHLGYTRGFARCSARYRHHGQPKGVLVRPLHPEARKMLATPYLSPQCRLEVKTMTLTTKHSEDLLQRLRQVPDPRLPRGIRHRKIAVLALAICAIFSNCRSLQAIGEWAQQCSQTMLARLDCRFCRTRKKYVPPSLATIRRVLIAIDAEAVDRAVSGWLQNLDDKKSPIAVDGKTIRGARQNGRQLQVLAAFLHHQGLALAQHAVEPSSNEMTALKPLLDPLDLQGRVITADALHTHEKTARYLCQEKQADYLLTVKDNQRLLKKDIQDLQLDAFPPSIPDH